MTSWGIGYTETITKATSTETTITIKVLNVFETGSNVSIKNIGVTVLFKNDSGDILYLPYAYNRVSTTLNVDITVTGLNQGESVTCYIVVHQDQTERLRNLIIEEINNIKG